MMKPIPINRTQDIYDAIRSVRANERRLTQSNLAALTNINAGSFCRFEYGAWDTRFSRIFHVLDTLGCKLVVVEKDGKS